jgi:hypothetical protein
MKSTLKSDSPNNPDKLSFFTLRWAIFIGLAILAIAGVVLIATAPFDGSARSSLGGSLLTGVVVGIAVVGFESSLDARRAAREETTKHKMHQEMIDSTNDRLAAFAATHVESLIVLFLNEQSERTAASDQPTEPTSESANGNLTAHAQPAGWRWPEDAQEISRALIWRAEVMRDEPSWWRSNLELAMTDAIYDVGCDLAQRFEFELDYEGREFVEGRSRTIDRLSGVAQRLSESGNARAAAELDTQVEHLLYGTMISYMPKLSLFGNQDYEVIIPYGRSSLEELRREFLWLTAQLRTHKISVNQDGDPIRDGSESAEEYRWGLLFSPSDNIHTAWDDRFQNNSWFRRLLTLAPSGLSKTKLGRLAQGSSDSS